MGDFINKLRNQPESTRKLILWVVVLIIGLGLTIWWINNSYRKIKEFPGEEVINKMNLPLTFPEGKVRGLPAFEKELPKIEMPEINEQ